MSTHAARGTRLTGRDIQVLTMFAHGLTAARIAERLHLSTRTVESHAVRVRSRLGARSMAHAVYLAASSGALPLLPPPGEVKP